MKKERVCQLLNEALAGRTVTAAAMDSVTSRVHGDVDIPYLVLDSVLKVELTFAIPRPQNVDPDVRAHGLQFVVGEQVNGVSITAGDDNPAEVVLHLTGDENTFFMRSVRFSPDNESEIDKALRNTGLQVPHHVLTDWNDKDDEEVDLGELLDNLTNPNHELFNIDFATEIMGIRPDWFSDEHRERVAAWAREHE